MEGGREKGSGRGGKEEERWRKESELTDASVPHFLGKSCSGGTQACDTQCTAYYAGRCSTN